MSHSYLLLKNGRYYVRHRIPIRITDWMDQRELRWSLQTGCLKTARKHLLIALMVIDELFDLVHMETAHLPLSQLEKIKLRNRIEEIKLAKLDEFRRLLRKGPRGVTQAERQLEQERPQIEAFQSALQVGHFDAKAVKHPASELLEVVPRLDQDFSALNPNYNYLAKEYCQGMVWQHDQKKLLAAEAVEQLKAISRPRTAPSVVVHLHGGQEGPSREEASHPSPGPAQAPTPTTPPIRISQLVQDYMAEQRAQGLLPKTVLEYEGVLKRFVDFLKDAPLHEIKRTDIRDFREALRKFPARLSSKQADLGFHALIAEAHDQTLGIATINKYMTRVSQVFHWASLNEYDVKPNIASDLTLSDNRRERDQRDRYEPEEITKLFSTPDFQGKEAFARSAYYWAPLIGLYTGMRIEEICQLRVQDVRLDKTSGIPVIDVNDDDEDRKLKPGESTPRVIPMHSKLVSLGLMEYANELRKRQHRMLFPTLNRHEFNGYSHAVSKWFSSHKTDLGFGKKLTFHSLRHTVSDTLKQAGVEEAMINAIMGHTGQASMSIKRYGKDYKPDVLAPVVEKLTFEIPAKAFRYCLLPAPEMEALMSPKLAAALRERRISTKRSAENPRIHSESVSE